MAATSTTAAAVYRRGHRSQEKTNASIGNFMNHTISLPEYGRRMDRCFGFLFHFHSENVENVIGNCSPWLTQHTLTQSLHNYYCFTIASVAVVRLSLTISTFSSVCYCYYYWFQFLNIKNNIWSEKMEERRKKKKKNGIFLFSLVFVVVYMHFYWFTAACIHINEILRVKIYTQKHRMGGWLSSKYIEICMHAAACTNDHTNFSVEVTCKFYWFLFFCFIFWRVPYALSAPFPFKRWARNRNRMNIYKQPKAYMYFKAKYCTISVELFTSESHCIKLNNNNHNCKYKKKQ